jgi:RTX calcium-binding nonapeptide repeat (4 copies)
MSTINTTINHGVTLTSGGTYTSPLTITNTGAVNYSSTGDAVFGTTAGDSVVNQGVVIGTSASNGIYLTGGTNYVDNQGRVTASAGSAIGIQLANGGTLSNSGTAIGGKWGFETRGATTLNNIGTIQGGNQGVVLNSYGGPSTATNTGIVIGADGLGIGVNAGVVINSATIYGSYGFGVALSAGGAVTNNAGGLIKGVGNAPSPYVGLLLYGGTTANVVNAGTISGYVGVQFFGGGHYSAAATLTDTGTILGTGATAIAFGTANDTLIIAGSSPKIQGIVNGGAGTNTLEFASDASAGTLTGADANFINFTNGTVDIGANWLLAGTDSFASTVTLTDGGLLVTTGTVNSAGQIIGASAVNGTGETGNDALAVAAGSLGNSGLIAGGAGGVGALGQNGGDGGTGVALAGGSLNNSGAIFGGHGGAGGYASVGGPGGGGGGGVGIYANSANLYTSGTIVGGAGGVGGGGLGPIPNGGAGGSGGTGLRIATSALTNNGLVTGGSGGAGGEANSSSGDGGAGGVGGVGVYVVSGSFTNNGTVAGGNGGVGGVGTIDGATGLSGDGVYVAAGNVTNNGTIAGGSGAGVGVYFHSSGTLVDSGAIIGGPAAVAFGGSGLLVLEAGYALSGAVVAATTANNEVELLGSSSTARVTATYNNLQLTNFGTIGFAAGNSNYADLKITNDASLPGVVTNFVGNHDTVDLTTLSYSSASSQANFNSITHELTVTNGASSVTLQLGSGSYTNVSWTVANDGSGGTDILSQSAHTDFTIHNETELNSAFTAISTGGTYATTNTNFNLTFANSFVLNSAVSTLALESGSSVTLNGAGFTLSSGGGAYGFINGAGPITVESLDIAGVVASVVSGASWSFAGTNTLGAGTTLTNSATVNDAGTLTDAGKIVGPVTLGTSTALLSVTSSGAVTNTGSAVLVGGGIGSVINDGMIAGGIGIAVSVGSVFNRGTITSTNSAEAVGATTIVNLGTISDTVSSVGPAVYAHGGSSLSIINGASTATNAVMLGGHDIVLMNGGSNGGTVVNYGTMSGGSFVGIYLEGSGGTLGLSNFGTILSSGVTKVVGVENEPGFATVNNTGVIQGTGGNTYGVVLRSNGSVTNSGLIASPGEALAIGNGFTVQVTNSGTLSGSVGFRSFTPSNQTLVDTGTIVGTGGTAAIFSTGDDLLQFQPSTSVFIQGTVDGGVGTNTLEFASGAGVGTLTGSNAYFINFPNGTVDAGADWTLAGNVTLGSNVSLQATGSLTDAGTLTNFGTLTGSGTLKVSGSLANAGQINFNGTTGGSAVQLALTSGASLTNLSGASIALVNANYHAVTPVIAGTGGPVTVTNLGTVRHGEVGISLGSGGRVVNGATNDTTALVATYDGIVSGFPTSSTIVNYGTVSSHDLGIGLQGFGVVINGAPNATAALITGGGGVDFADNAGTVINFGSIIGVTYGSIIHTDGVEMYYGDSGTVINHGTIAGNQYSVKFNSAASSTRFGPLGDDLLKLYPGAVLIGTATAAGTGNVLELASGTGSGTIGGIGTSVLGLGTINVDVGAAWTLTGNNSVGAGYTLTDAGTLTNAGTLSGYLYLSAGQLTNLASGRIENTYIQGLSPGGASYVTNYGTITSTNVGHFTMYLAGTGNLTNAAGALINGPLGLRLNGPNATVVNLGSINAYEPGGSTDPILLNNGGVVINGATNDTTAVISGYYQVGIFSIINSSYKGTVVNDGSIVSTSTLSPALRLSNGGNVINGVSNVTTALLQGGRYGLANNGSGNVTNYGTIRATQTSGTQYGVLVSGSGTISNLGASALIQGYTGIEFVGTGTVIDSGTISGTGDAMDFFSTNNLLVLEHGYTMHGAIVAGSPAGNVVELLGTSAANAVTANYNGLGLTNFRTISFAPGAGNYATLQITNNSKLPGTIANFAGAHDAIDLTALAFVTGSSYATFSSSTHLLKVGNGTSTVTLRLGNGAYSGFSVAKDAGIGTEIQPASLPAISGAAANQGVPDETPSNAFSGVTITDPGGADTVKATLAPGGTGTFSNGSGTYVVSGTPGVVTTELQSLSFTPIAQPNQYVSTTDFTISVTGAGGSVSDSTANVTSVQQILGLATVSPSNIAITVSPDGTGFAAPIGGDTNEAVVRAPVSGDVFALPASFQAEFLGGSANVKLTDKTVGDALLVGNQGNDVLVATANNDTVQAGSGKDTLYANGAQTTLLGGSGNALMLASSGTGDLLQAGTGADTIFTSSSGTVTGSFSDLIGLFGSTISNVVTLTGKLDTVGGSGSVTISAASSASDALIFGSSTSTVFTDQGTADTIVAGAGATTINASRSTFIFGANAASLQVIGGTTTPTVVGGSGSTSISAGSGGIVFAGGSGSPTISGAATLFGSAGNSLNYTGATGGTLAVFDSGAETIDASTSSTANVFWGGLDSKGADLMSGGSGNDTLIAGTGSDTMTGGAGNNLFAFIASQAGGANAVTDFTTNDTVHLFNYGATAASAALMGAASSAGNTTLTLSDGTSITFMGVASASTLTGHVFST